MYIGMSRGAARAGRDDCSKAESACVERGSTRARA
jgi:hypothetical protein